MSGKVIMGKKRATYVTVVRNVMYRCRDIELHKRWVIKIRREKFLTTNTRVCSRQFQSEDVIEPPTPAGRRRLKKGAVPVLFQWNNFSLPAPRPRVWERTERPNTETTHDPSVELDYPPDHDYCDSSEPAALDMSLNRIEASIHAHLMAFWKQIEPATCKMVRVTRARSVAKNDEVPHTGSATILQPIDEFFLFMNYLSLGLMQKDLAHRFKIHQSTVSRIINTWANFLYTVLGAVGIWLDEETVKSHMPESEVFSNYKSHCTFKGLIGMAPHGAVTFVSSLYEGSISDKEILKQSGIVPLLNPSMAIMVDKGFLVEDCVPCKVHIPTFLCNRAQLSEPEVRKTQSIARLRVHVERLIRRVKEHKLFGTEIPLSLTGSINQLYTVACLLVNYQNGPLVKAWATNG
ncbi:unnamed protein product [Leuciscus chuanchicus]